MPSSHKGGSLSEMVVLAGETILARFVGDCDREETDEGVGGGGRAGLLLGVDGILPGTKIGPLLVDFSLKTTSLISFVGGILSEFLRPSPIFAVVSP